MNRWVFATTSIIVCIMLVVQSFPVNGTKYLQLPIAIPFYTIKLYYNVYDRRGLVIFY